MLTLNSPQVAQETALRWKRESKIALVPTMGCLHEAHAKLVRRAKEYGQKVVTSIFVNPLQFGPTEDFERYPRPFEMDAEKLEALGVDLLFHPEPRDIYPDGFQTKIHVGALAQALCGASRPGHFDGVATVVMKLFQILQPDFAVFGEKDFQQLRILQQMTADLNLPVTIIPHETVREPDGLALSSRNRYLSPDAREKALAISAALRAAREIAAANPRVEAGHLVGAARTRLEDAGLVVDYVAVASSLDLRPAAAGTPITELTEPRLFIAAKIGATRLIDNAALSGAGTAA